jgi:hypothetical protein
MHMTAAVSRMAALVETLDLTSNAITTGSTGSATAETVPPYFLVAVHLTPSTGADSASADLTYRQSKLPPIEAFRTTNEPIGNDRKLRPARRRSRSCPGDAGIRRR